MIKIICLNFQETLDAIAVFIDSVSALSKVQKQFYKEILLRRYRHLTGIQRVIGG